MTIRDGAGQKLNVVPSICQPLESQPIDMCMTRYLFDLILADSPDDEMPLEIDLLIGLDFYWSLLLEKFVEGRLEQLPSTLGLSG